MIKTKLEAVKHHQFNGWKKPGDQYSVDSLDEANRIVAKGYAKHLKPEGKKQAQNSETPNA